MAAKPKSVSLWWFCCQVFKKHKFCEVNMMAKKVITLGLVIAIAIFLSGCNRGDYERRTDTSNTLYVGVVESSFPMAFMPWLSRDGIAPTISSMLYDTLFSYDDETGDFLPVLAKEWYYVDSNGDPLITDLGSIDYERLETDGLRTILNPQNGRMEPYLTVKIILNEDATWSDGTQVTAKDIYYSFDIAKNNFLSNHAGALAWTSDLLHLYSNQGVLQLQGIFTYEEGALENGYFIDEEKKDHVIFLHVRGVLGAVTSLFTTVLILPEHLWKPVVSRTNQLNSRDPSSEIEYLYKNPVGSGPWTLSINESGSSMIVLERRGDYHLTDELGGPLYKVDKIKLVLYQDVNVAIYAVMRGHIDILNSNISPNYARLFEGRDHLFLSVAEGVYVQSLVMNVNPEESQRNAMKDLLMNPDIRKAIALAVDPDELIELVANSAGVRMSAGLISSRLSDFYNPNADILSGNQTSKVNTANQILDELYPSKDQSGYRLKNGERISFNILGHPGEIELISFLEIQFQKIGIEVNYQAKGSSPEVTYLWNSRFDMTIQGVIFSLANVDIMFNAHFVALGRTSNYGRLQNSELAGKIEEMRTTLNLNRKYELIYELQPLIAEQYYKIPLYSSNVISIGRTDRYTGYYVESGATLFNTRNLQSIQRVSS
jgi:ABC-type transport system substrate-binding protein